MSRFLAGKFIASIFVLFGVSVFTFALVRLVPGDPVRTMLGTDAGDADAAAIRRLYGLDRPWPVQYVEWLARAAQGDLGKSLRTGLSVSESILQRLPITLELTLLAVALGLLIGVPFAILAAQARGRLADGALSVLVLFGISMPGFWLA